MLPAPAIPDYLGDLRAWARGQPALVADQGARVFFRIPDTPTFPLTQMLEILTDSQPGEAPVFDARLAFYIWGGAKSDYAAVSRLARAYLGLFKVPGPWLAGAGTVVLNAEAGVRDIPDPETGNPRKVVDAVLTLRALGPGDSF